MKQWLLKRDVMSARLVVSFESSESMFVLPLFCFIPTYQGVKVSFALW